MDVPGVSILGTRGCPEVRSNEVISSGSNGAVFTVSVAFKVSFSGFDDLIDYRFFYFFSSTTLLLCLESLLVILGFLR